MSTAFDAQVAELGDLLRLTARESVLALLGERHAGQALEVEQLGELADGHPGALQRRGEDVEDLLVARRRRKRANLLDVLKGLGQDSDDSLLGKVMRQFVLTHLISLGSLGREARVGASPAEGPPRAGRRRRRAPWISRAVAAATSAAAVGLSIAARRERARARYWRSAAELELHLHNPAKLLRLQAAHDSAPGRLAAAREQLLALSVRLIAGRPFNQSRAGVAAPARVSM